MIGAMSSPQQVLGARRSRAPQAALACSSARRGTMLLTLLVGSLASFAVGRMRPSNGSWLTNAALLTYTVPASFLIFPFTGAFICH